MLGLLVAGIGALLAIGWELGEWYTFIRHGTELDTAYEDTLFDEVLGSLGGGARRDRRRAPTPPLRDGAVTCEGGRERKDADR